MKKKISFKSANNHALWQEGVIESIGYQQSNQQSSAAGKLEVKK